MNPEQSADSAALATEQEQPSAIKRALWALAWPVVAEQGLAMLTQVVDMSMVGRLGPRAVTAVGLTMHPFFLANALVMGLSVATTALAARAAGAGNREEAGRVTGQSILIAVVLGIAVASAGYVLAPQIVAFMRAGPDVAPMAILYVKAMMPGMVAFYVFTIATGALRGAGDTLSPMVINLITNAVHVGTNFVLIFGYLGFPRLEVTGAGISTSISRILAAVLVLGVLSSSQGKLHVNWRNLLPFDWALFGRLINVGLPAALERVLTSSGQMMYSRQVAGLGTVPYAAHSLSLNVESFSYMPGMGFATAATALVGQNLGAGRPDRAEASAKEAMKFGVLTMGSMGALFFTFPQAFLKIFTDDAETIALAVPLLRIVAFTQIPEALGFVIPGALRGAGDTRIAVYVTVAGMWIVRLGLTYLMMDVFHMGLEAAWIAMLMDWVVRSTLYAIRFKQGKWKELRV
ncbi:MAG: MATE family efflux transporter [Firmicutes bacterium]|nr:MATE family efflux transporter [Candidatus Fermentithermobacillaceae bacterium]